MEHGASGETAASVRAELARRNIKAVELHRRFGWSKSTVSRRLAGEYPFTITELVQIAEFLGCPLSDLLPPPRAVA